MVQENDETTQAEELPGGFLRVAGGTDDDEENGDGVPEGAIPVRVERGADGANAETAQLRAELAQLRGEVARLRTHAGLEARRDMPATVGDVIDALRAERDAARAEIGELLRQHYPRGRGEIASVFREVLTDGLSGSDEEDDQGAARKAAAGKKGASEKAATRPGRKRGHLYRDSATGELYVWGRTSELDEVLDDGERFESA